MAFIAMTTNVFSRPIADLHLEVAWRFLLLDHRHSVRCPLNHLNQEIVALQQISLREPNVNKSPARVEAGRDIETSLFESGG